MNNSPRESTINIHIITYTQKESPLRGPVENIVREAFFIDPWKTHPQDDIYFVVHVKCLSYVFSFVILHKTYFTTFFL